MGRDIAWEVAKTFEDEPSGLQVQVSRLPLQSPRYNVSVGMKRQDGSSGRYIVPDVVVHNAVADVAKGGMVLARLFDEAMLYVQEQVQKEVDQDILRRQLREQRQIDRETGKTDVARTGKTEREAAKRARHENNLASRRSEDQERTRNTKGKGK